MRISVTVNGQTHQLDVEPRLLLVDVLRDRLELTSPKVGCDTGQCGSCVVLMDGASVKSCALLAVQADGSSLETTEGLSPPGTMNPLQAGFQSAHAVQCGYCTPGMIMSLTDLLARSSHPSEADVRAWLSGSLCRCTGYENVVRAVTTAVQVSDSPAHLVPTSPLVATYDALLRAMADGDAEALVDGHYHHDAVLTTFEGIHVGRDALITYFREYLAANGDAKLIATERATERDDSLYVESLVRGPDGTRRTYHAYVVRDGKITHQFAGVK